MPRRNPRKHFCRAAQRTIEKAESDKIRAGRVGCKVFAFGVIRRARCFGRERGLQAPFLPYVRFSGHQATAYVAAIVSTQDWSQHDLAARITRKGQREHLFDHVTVELCDEPWKFDLSAPTNIWWGTALISGGVPPNVWRGTPLIFGAAPH